MGYIGAGPTRFNTADELTVTGDAEFNGNLTVKGTTTTIDSVTVQNFDMGDNDRIRIGDSQDLQIYHDGSNSYIYDGGAGNLIIKATDIRIRTATDENYITATQDGALSLYYDNAAKLATTATGVDVTGVITTDGLTTSADITFGDNDKAIFGAGSMTCRYSHDGAAFIVCKINEVLATGQTKNKLAKYVRSHNAIMLVNYLIRAIGWRDSGASILFTTTTQPKTRHHRHRRAMSLAQQPLTS